MTRLFCHRRKTVPHYSSLLICLIVNIGTEGSVVPGRSLPGQLQQQQHGGSTVVVVHGSADKTKKSEDSERDSESITLDQFLNECNKSPKSRVCGLLSFIRV